MVLARLSGGNTGPIVDFIGHLICAYDRWNDSPFLKSLGPVIAIPYNAMYYLVVATGLPRLLCLYRKLLFEVFVTESHKVRTWNYSRRSGDLANRH